MLLIYTTTIGACTKQRAHLPKSIKSSYALIRATKIIHLTANQFFICLEVDEMSLYSPSFVQTSKITDSKSILYLPPIWQNKFIIPISCQSFIVQIHFDKIIHTPSVFLKLKNLLQTHFSFSIDVTKQIHVVQTLKFRCNLAK